MLATGQVLFCRGHEEDEGSDIWDDTALIQAYDQAVNAMKTKMGLVSTAKAVQGSAEPKKKKKKGRRKHSHRKDKPASVPSDPSKWKTGDHCRAVFTEDGQVYEAVVRSVHGEMCVVRYLGYGNEEEQLTADLLPSLAGAQSDIHSENESMDWSQGLASPVFGASQPRLGPHIAPAQGRGHSTLGRGSSYLMPPPPPPSRPGISFGAVPSTDMPTVPPFPAMPPLFPPGMLGMGMPPIGSLPGLGMPPVPPSMSMPQMPPPPVIDGDMVNDEEALHSMLISWYMTGYHTGYYQGLKQARKGTSSVKKDTASDNKSDVKETNMTNEG